jgi:hypothetical protein
MIGHRLKYAFMSNYNESIFLEVKGGDCGAPYVYYSDIIKSDDFIDAATAPDRRLPELYLESPRASRQGLFSPAAPEDSLGLKLGRKTFKIEQGQYPEIEESPLAHRISRFVTLTNSQKLLNPEGPSKGSSR